MWWCVVGDFSVSSPSPKICLFGIFKLGYNYYGVCWDLYYRTGQKPINNYNYIHFDILTFKF